MAFTQADNEKLRNDLVDFLLTNANKELDGRHIKQISLYLKNNDVNQINKLNSSILLTCFKYKDANKDFGDIFEVIQKSIKTSLSEYMSSFFDDTSKPLAYMYFNNNIKSKDHFNEFISMVKYMRFPNYNDNLIDLCIKFSIEYLKYLEYAEKIESLRLIEHLIRNITHADINFNNRSLLLYNNLSAYLHDRESTEFSRHLLETLVVHVLNGIEPDFNKNRHNYKFHSEFLESLLNNAYVITNVEIKLLYYEYISKTVKTIGQYTCRHIVKVFQVVYEFLDFVQIKNPNESRDDVLALGLCLDLVDTVIDACSMRMHQHGESIIKFLIKLLYYSSLDENAACSPNFDFKSCFSNGDRSAILTDRFYIRNCCIYLLTKLFRLDSFKKKFAVEFALLANTDYEANRFFMSYINFILVKSV
jgi:hypothetical protein